MTLTAEKIGTRFHPETGQVLIRSVREQTVSVGSLSRMIEVPGWYPEGDSDSIHSGADLQALNEAYKELRAAYAARVKAVRKKLRLTQEEAGRIIGGGRRAFQKYESGATSPSDAAVGLLEILDRHPEELETLRSIRSRSQATGLSTQVPSHVRGAPAVKRARRAGPGGMKPGLSEKR